MCTVASLSVYFMAFECFIYTISGPVPSSPATHQSYPLQPPVTLGYPNGEYNPEKRILTKPFLCAKGRREGKRRNSTSIRLPTLPPSLRITCYTRGYPPGCNMGTPRSATSHVPNQTSCECQEEPGIKLGKKGMHVAGVCVLYAHKLISSTWQCLLYEFSTVNQNLTTFFGVSRLIFVTQRQYLQFS